MKLFYAVMFSVLSLTSLSTMASPMRKDLPLLPEEYIDHRYNTPLVHGFIPSTGYDNNDQVEFVAYGYLPNSCFQLSGYRVERSNSGRTLYISVLSERLTTGICAQVNGTAHEVRTAPAELLTMVPFSAVLPLGQLSVGDYQVSYPQFLGGPQFETVRTFSISEAQTQTIDNTRYATVQSVNIASVQQLNTQPRATVSLTLTSSCMRVAGIDVQRVDNDVFVVLPRIESIEDRVCTFELRAEEHTIPMGTLDAAGTYLLHVRSHGGRSENKVFTVQ